MTATAREGTLALPGRLDSLAVRADFPILGVPMHGRPLVFLDSAASSQKPRQVLDAERRFYETSYANIHRGVYELSARATEAWDAARRTLARYLGARLPHEVIFTRGTTGGINLVAQGFLRPRLRPGDEILVTAMEHHSNIVPWQLVAAATGAVLRVAPITDQGELVLDAIEALLGPRTRMVALAHVSNALGTINPVARVVEMAHARGIPVLVDGAQAAPHLPVDVQALGADFYACSSHKMFGPTGIGALYGREELLETVLPVEGGGDMIATVTFERSTWAPLPARLEAGTPHIAGAVGFAAAADYIEAIGRETIAAYEHDLLVYATERIAAVPGVRLIGTAAEKASVLSFVMQGVHPHDIGTVLDAEGICVRTGHHCAQPLMQRFGLPATARASFALYNTREDADALARGLERVREVFG
ncbi:MAG TPA: cysteine desulfurase [Gemmatimonadales bacterium]|nr:cysteine desulfurase [Gemmatimonadales bacterium]